MKKRLLYKIFIKFACDVDVLYLGVLFIASFILPYLLRCR